MRVCFSPKALKKRGSHFHILLILISGVSVGGWGEGGTCCSWQLILRQTASHRAAVRGCVVWAVSQMSDCRRVIT